MIVLLRRLMCQGEKHYLGALSTNLTWVTFYVDFAVMKTETVGEVIVMRWMMLVLAQVAGWNPLNKVSVYTS